MDKNACDHVTETAHMGSHLRVHQQKNGSKSGGMSLIHHSNIDEVKPFQVPRETSCLSQLRRKKAGTHKQNTVVLLLNLKAG